MEDGKAQSPSVTTGADDQIHPTKTQRQRRQQQQRRRRKRQNEGAEGVTKSKHGNQQQRRQNGGDDVGMGNGLKEGRKEEDVHVGVNTIGEMGVGMKFSQRFDGDTTTATVTVTVDGDGCKDIDKDNGNGNDNCAKKEELQVEDERTESHQESFDRASADLEMICAAYADEITVFQTSSIKSDSDSKDHTCIPSWFPLIFTLTLPPLSGITNDSATITMELPKGYPAHATLQIVSYRGLPPSSAAVTREYVEAAVHAVRSAAARAMDPYGTGGGDDDGESGEGEECAFACCAAAIESWRESSERIERSVSEGGASSSTAREADGIGSGTNGDAEEDDDDVDIRWVTSDDKLVDRKSVFQAHVCPIDSEIMVRKAVDRLISGSGRIQRASHNMYAYRFVDTLPSGRQILKHDNDDDGEAGSGSRLAHLLEMRKEEGVLVLVTRWYGGTHLGPKRFAHIVNVARELLVECHATGGCLAD